MAGWPPPGQTAHSMPDYLRCHVRLLDVKPKLWRRFLLKITATFQDLHLAIQDACGWENCHMFAFRSPNGRESIAGIPDTDWGPAAPDARKQKLSAVFGPKGLASCLYEYDFGDGWTHEVKCEGVEKLDERFERRLLDGAGAFPPEDCGSVPGYERCVAAVTGKGWRKREHGDDAERRELLEWLGAWRPDSFDLAATKQQFDR
jgi:hypothetical protein